MNKRGAVRAILLSQLFLVVPIALKLVYTDASWSMLDFIAASILLGALGLSLQIIAALIKKRESVYKPALVVIVLILLILLWAELAVGLFNSPFAGN